MLKLRIWGVQLAESKSNHKLARMLPKLRTNIGGCAKNFVKLVQAELMRFQEIEWHCKQPVVSKLVIMELLCSRLLLSLVFPPLVGS